MEFEVEIFSHKSANTTPLTITLNNLHKLRWIFFFPSHRAVERASLCRDEATAKLWRYYNAKRSTIPTLVIVKQ